ncbi:MAG: fructose-1,6-bisphosphatase [Paludibacteraceae bacterium]|nr:fructose-1,6-bisphosphatase [Paludibacteraceae bacterium]
MTTENDIQTNKRYLQLLSEKFSNSDAAISEIINLQAIMSLPKGTEHFVSDLHGASTEFIHMVKNASGVIRRKVDDVFANTITEEEKRALCALIYYPDERLDMERPILEVNGKLNDFYSTRLHQIVEVARAVTVKYTRSKVRKLLPADYGYVIEELLHESPKDKDRANYFNSIINSIIETGRAEQLIIAISYLIHSLAIDVLHVVGDVFDRGPGAEKIMEILSSYHNFDVQWGNHDIEWMGAAAGNLALIATVVRVSIRYVNIETLEEGYGINLLPLATFALDTYGDDPCTYFKTKDFENNPRLKRSAALMAKMHKAISVIQFKLEGQTILRHPEYNMQDRLLLDKINWKDHTVGIAGTNYPLLDYNLPTIDPTDPYKLSVEEQALVDQLARSFRKSEHLQKHLRSLYQHGSLFLCRNNFLLYHAAIPMTADGNFQEVDICGKRVSGRALMERADQVIRNAYYGKGKSATYHDSLDYMWYLWCGEFSPLYNKDKMTTFERYFVADKSVQKEVKGAYYELANRRDICEKILQEFGIDPAEGRIINGHIPVRTIKGETPMRAEGKRFVIDGGFSKPYQEKTGIAGYTLIYNSHGIQLVEHEMFESRQEAIRSGADIHSRIELQDFSGKRMLVRDTDLGQQLQQQVEDLKQLVSAYEHGIIKEKQ